ncbi:MAG: CBS domain-containing protein [Bdellovibrio sp. CG10_big_fil_rev_8_21_14_0_10_47_8]|nr:MAG: CBS domain-containing protein [Bdellovibrio sp. CG10_big_fil_rev_8_21_14_0_10_47_8]
MKSIPQVQKYMTTTPYAINAESTIQEAQEMMKKHGIRHLPVRDGEKYGVVSDRDIKYAMSLSGFDVKSAKVRDICEETPYITKPDASISAVSAELAERRVGSALIMDNQHLVGIYTTTDACRALSDLCENRLDSHKEIKNTKES